MSTKLFTGSPTSYSGDSMGDIRKTALRLLTMGQSMLVTLAVLFLAWGALELHLTEERISAQDDTQCMRIPTFTDSHLTEQDIQAGPDNDSPNIASMAVGFAFAGVVILTGANSPSHKTGDMLYWLQMSGVFLATFLLAISFLLSSNVIMSHQCIVRSDDYTDFTGYAYDQVVGAYSVIIVVIIFGFFKNMVRAYGTARNPGASISKALSGQVDNQVPTAGTMVQTLVWQGLSRMTLSVIGLIFGIWLLSIWHSDFLVDYNYEPEENTTQLTDLPTFESTSDRVFWVNPGEAVSQHCDHLLGDRINTYSYMIPNLATATLVLSAVQLAMEGALLFLTGWNASQARNSTYTSTKVIVFLNYWTRLGLQITLSSFFFTLLLSNTTFRHCPLIDLGDDHVRSFVNVSSVFGGFFIWAMLVAVNSTFIDIVSKYQRMNMNFGLVGQV